MSATAIVARLTFQEAARRRVLAAALGVGLLFLALFALGFNLIRSDIATNLDDPTYRVVPPTEIYSYLLTAGLYVVNFLTVMMTVLTSVDTLSGEVASGTMQSLASKPVRRWQIVLGKWLGFAGMLSLYLLLMAGGLLTIVFVLAGYVPPGAGRGLAMMWLNVLLLLSLSLLGGTMLSTLANGVMIFGLYGVAFVGGWIEQVGAFLGNQTAISVGTVSSLLMPSEALWKRAAFELRSPLSEAMGISPFVSPSVPNLLMVAYALGYTLLMLALAIRQFNRRDL